MTSIVVFYLNKISILKPARCFNWYDLNNFDTRQFPYKIYVCFHFGHVLAIQTEVVTKHAY